MKPKLEIVSAYDPVLAVLFHKAGFAEKILGEQKLSSEDVPVVRNMFRNIRDINRQVGQKIASGL